VTYHGAFERLEPDEVNISSPVLRGRRAGNGPLLPDTQENRPFSQFHNLTLIGDTLSV